MDNIKEKLLQIKHYQKHPQMIPFIGDDYGKKYKKLLVVAESHYISNCDENSKPRDPQEYENTIKNWYDLNCKQLKFYDIESTNTSELIYKTNLINDNDNNHIIHKLYSTINGAIQDNPLTKLNEGEKLFKHIAFMNFYQRPADTDGGSVIPIDEDNKFANDNLYEVVQILKPDCITILSSLVCDNLETEKFSKYSIGYSCHPVSPWWNIECSKYTNVLNKEKLTGRESFVDFVTYHEIFK
jgi:hypothetical protein